MNYTLSHYPIISKNQQKNNYETNLHDSNTEINRRKLHIIELNNTLKKIEDELQKKINYKLANLNKDENNSETQNVSKTQNISKDQPINEAHNIQQNSSINEVVKKLLIMNKDNEYQNVSQLYNHIESLITDDIIDVVNDKLINSIFVNK